MMSAMVSNNDSNLYIALKFYKQEIQFQMVTSGMTLTIDTAGKKDGGYSVIYPLGRKSRMEVGDPNQKPSGAMMRGNIGNDRRDHILMAMGPSMLLSGFDGLEKREYQLHNCGSIAIKTVLDSNNFLFYQLQIPFAQMQTLRNTYRNLDTNRVFHLNINIKAVSISRPPNHPNGGGMQHPPGQGGGMRPSGGPPPGGGQGGPHPDISQVSNDIRLRIPFVLKLNDL
ncbi:MAG: hypothetical protein JXR87_08430 [Candidatus Marinimicrobia bacterium]|nr:hypothetical protein [Candidatus Neomarinimicrobiota bacterium]